MKSISINGNNLSLEQIDKVARKNARASLAASAIAKMNKSKKMVDKAIKSGTAVYGLNTGFR